MSKPNFIKPDYYKVYQDDMLKLSENSLLEKKVVNRLKKEKLIIDNSFLARNKWFIAACISFVCFLAGYKAADLSDSSTFEPNYMILLLEDEEFNPPQDLNLVHAYGSWMNSILEEGVKIKGSQLNNLTDQKLYQSTTNGADITGYFFLRSNSEEQLLKIAESMPHKKFGGKISLKKIKP